MYSEITAAVQSLNALATLAKTAYSVSTQLEKDQLRIHLNEALLDMQGKLFAMQAKMGELAESESAAKANLLAYENWAAQADRYELKSLRAGIVVYTPKSDDQGTAPAYWLCPNCFEQKGKSYLTCDHPLMNLKDYKCARCKYSFKASESP